MTFGNCCLGGVILLIALIIGSAILIAKTGLLEIPFLSKYFYEPLTPSYPVPDLASMTVEQLLASKLGDGQLMARARSDAISGQAVNLTFNEQELTRIFRTLLITEAGATETDADTFALRDVQVAIIDEELEIFGNLIKPIDTQLLVKVQPTFEGEHLGLKITQVRLGQAPMPGFILNRTIGVFLDAQIKELEAELASRAVLTDVNVRNDHLTLTGILQ